MEAKIKVNSRVIVSVEGRDEPEVFEGLAKAQETFSDEACGCCNSTNFRYVVRENNQGHKFYELRCENNSCRAQLSFGNSGKQLYPKRRWDALGDPSKSDERTRRAYQKEYADKNYGRLPDNGWFKWSDVKKHNPELAKGE